MKVLQENGLKAFMTSILNKFIKKTDTEQVSTIDIDTTPTTNSNNLVTSGGVASAISTKQNLIDNTITGTVPATLVGVDTVVTQNSSNLITSGAVYNVVGDIESLLAALR